MTTNHDQGNHKMIMTVYASLMLAASIKAE